MSTRIPLRFGRLGPLLWALGMSRRSSYLEVGSETLTVRGGLWFSARVPRTSITALEHGPDRPWSIGVHGWRGTWTVNGAASPIARLTIDPPAAARTLGLRVGLRVLELSVDDPAALALALGLPPVDLAQGR
jgi:hypothetical protein